MINDILTGITRQYHDSAGHINPAVDRMMDSVSGRGHRIQYGHDMQALIESYHIDGIEGVGGWFDHMIKDFTTTDGIPLPFAKAISEITGMSTSDTIDWLCINAADAIMLGGQAALLKLFKDKPNMYKAAVVIGTMLGIIDDNPLLVGFNAVIILKGLKNTGRMDWLFTPAGNALGKCLNVVSKVSVGVAVTNIGLGLAGLNIAEIVDSALSVADNIDGILDIADRYLLSNDMRQLAVYLRFEMQPAYPVILHQNGKSIIFTIVGQAMEEDRIFQIDFEQSWGRVTGIREFELFPIPPTGVWSFGQ